MKKQKNCSEVITLLLSTVSERQAPPIHFSLGLTWIGGACLSETVASNKVFTSERVLFLKHISDVWINHNIGKEKLKLFVKIIKRKCVTHLFSVRVYQSNVKIFLSTITWKNNENTNDKKKQTTNSEAKANKREKHLQILKNIF